jgi:hypothetical protein
MKKLTFISGGLSGSLIGLSILFKSMHFPGGSIVLILGLGIFSILFIPCLTKYLYDRSK